MIGPTTPLDGCTPGVQTGRMDTTPRTLPPVAAAIREFHAAGGLRPHPQGTGTVPGLGAWLMLAGEYDDIETIEVYVGTVQGAEVRADDLTAQRSQPYQLEDDVVPGRWHRIPRDMVGVRAEEVSVFVDAAVVRAAAGRA